MSKKDVVDESEDWGVGREESQTVEIQKQTQQKKIHIENTNKKRISKYYIYFIWNVHVATPISNVCTKGDTNRNYGKKTP